MNTQGKIRLRNALLAALLATSLLCGCGEEGITTPKKLVDPDSKNTPALSIVATATSKAMVKATITPTAMVITTMAASYTPKGTDYSTRTPKVTPKIPLTPTPLSASFTDEKHVKMVLILGGIFQMGSQNGRSNEAPVHNIYLDAFYMDVFEVTNGSYFECVAAGECQPPTAIRSHTRDSYYGNPQYSDYPVIYVTWEMARTYCEWRGGELPSEAQWEKAARGGLQEMDYPWGNERPICKQGAKNGANSYGCTTEDTERIGRYFPNGYGLYDMAGNVFEWIKDWYSDSYSNVLNPFKDLLVLSMALTIS